MKYTRTVLVLAGLLALALAVAAGLQVAAGPSWALKHGAVRVDTTLAAPVMLAGSQQKNYLRVALTGVDTRPEKRAPVNVAIVLDRSGSMSGQKIEQAKRAAIAALSQLQDEDIVSVISYASNVSVLVPATKLTDRESLYRQIRAISSGGSTALFAGVSKGAQEVRKFAEENRVTSIVLLSDGIANVGPSTPGELAELGATLGREGMTVTTIGLGLGFNEDLMSQLALRSEGNHFFVENATDLVAVFATEFGDALSVTAQDATVEIECPEGIRPVRMLGREASIRGQRVVAHLNQIYQNQTKYVLLEIEVAPGLEGRGVSAANVTVSYRDLGHEERQTQRSSASIRFTNSQAEVAAAEHRETMISAVTLIAVENNKVAVALRDEGKIEEARAALISNASFAEKSSLQYDSAELKDYAGTQSTAAENLDEKSWNKERKTQIEQNMKKSSNRAVTPKKRSDKD